MFALNVKYRGNWRLKWMCDALGVSRSGIRCLAQPHTVTVEQK